MMEKLLNFYNKFIVYIFFPFAFILLLSLVVIFYGHNNQENAKNQAAIINTAFQVRAQSNLYQLDCSAYTQTVYRQNNIILPRSSAQQFSQGFKIDSTKLEPGDLIFFRIYGGSINHVGIYIDSTFFIHANTSKGITVNSWNEPYWSNRLAGFVSPVLK